MTGKPLTLQEMLIKLDRLLKTIPDEPKSLPEFTNFIRLFLRTKVQKGSSLPTIEVMTVIKHEKPNIFYMMRKRATDVPILDLVTHIEMDYEAAKQRLSKIIE